MINQGPLGPEKHRVGGHSPSKWPNSHMVFFHGGDPANLHPSWDDPPVISFLGPRMAWHTPPKTNVDTQNDGWQKVTPFISTAICGLYVGV